MKAQFEHVKFPIGCSVRTYDRRVASIPFQWHHHPQCELTLTLNSRGWRFVGDHIGAYGSHDLVMLPPDMPHTWASTTPIDEEEPHRAIVIWFSAAWVRELAGVCPEYNVIDQLLRNATRGSLFPASAGRYVEKRLQHLLSDSPYERLHATLDILTELARTDSTPLTTAERRSSGAAEDRSTLARVLARLHERFDEPVRMADLAAVANVSLRTLHRVFVRHVGETVTEYLCGLRIGRACMLLIETELPIKAIAVEAGFSNLSNFNRSFLKGRGMTPRAFRQFIAVHRRIPDVAGVRPARKASVLDLPPRGAASRERRGQTRPGVQPSRSLGVVYPC